MAPKASKKENNHNKAVICKICKEEMIIDKFDIY